MKTQKSLLPLKLFFLLLMLYFTAQNAIAETIRVSVDRNPVGLNESFEIHFTSSTSPDGNPDFSPLEQDFTILNQSQSNQSSWVNGKSSRTIQWILTVIPKTAGNLTIPAIAFGRDSSERLEIEVLPTPSNAPESPDLFLEVEATPLTPLVQSQVIYTLRLFRKVEIAQAQLTDPEHADAVVSKLGDDRNFSTTIKGVDFSVIERKYAIFPQKSGKLTFKPLVLTAEVVTSARGGLGGFFNATQTRRVISKEITLDVKAIPANLTSAHWLSAEQLDVQQEWSGDFEQMKVGEPLTRTLRMQAQGATVSSLPEMNSKLDTLLKTYPDQPILKEQKTNDGLLALREEKIAIIPTKAGSYTLPAIKIPWFNSKTNKMELAKIPETTITVLAAETTPATKSTTAPITTPPAEISTAPVIQQTTTAQPQSFWLWVSLFLALGWLSTLLFFLKKCPVTAPDSANTQAELNLKAIIQQLKKACADNNAPAAKTALLAWGAEKFAATSLGAIADYCDARLRDEILQLNQVLYAKNAPAWSGKKLYQAFAENKAREKMPVIQEDRLQPLHRL